MKTESAQSRSGQLTARCRGQPVNPILPTAMSEGIRLRVHGDASLPTLVYLPGLHGDWTLVSSFRAAVAGRARFVECAYPRTATWSLEDYAGAIAAALAAHGIERGWLLGESFGSQPAWQLIARCLSADPPASRMGASALLASASQGGAPPATAVFRPEGLILAGGFVRHPVPPGVRLLRRLNAGVRTSTLARLLRLYAVYARVRHHHARATLNALDEFVSNRLAPGDAEAIVHRLDLIASNDPRPVARQTRLPVRYLAGLVDPLVPFPFVRVWLWRHCPGYGGGRTLFNADHNVLATAPQASATQILAWMKAKGSVLMID
jgi:pimeloyl-ACP methyl ester carboxylesterase